MKLFTEVYKEDLLLDYSNITPVNFIFNLQLFIKELQIINRHYKTNFFDYLKYQLLYLNEIILVKFEGKKCFTFSYYLDKQTKNVWFHINKLPALDTIEPNLRQCIKQRLMDSFKDFCVYTLEANKILITYHKNDRETSIASKKYGFTEVKNYNQQEHLGYMNVQ